MGAPRRHRFANGRQPLQPTTLPVKAKPELGQRLDPISCRGSSRVEANDLPQCGGQIDRRVPLRDELDRNPILTVGRCIVRVLLAQREPLVIDRPGLVPRIDSIPHGVHDGDCAFVHCLSLFVEPPECLTAPADASRTFFKNAGEFVAIGPTPWPAVQ